MDIGNGQEMRNEQVRGEEIRRWQPCLPKG